MNHPNGIHPAVQLPTLVAHTNMDTEAVSILREHFVDILKFIAKNQKELFVEYENAEPGYIANVKA